MFSLMLVPPVLLNYAKSGIFEIATPKQCYPNKPRKIVNLPIR